MQFTASALAEDDTAQAPFSLQETPFKPDFSERPNLKGPGARLKGQQHSANVGYVCHKLAQMTLQTGDLTLQLEGHFGLYAPSFGLPKTRMKCIGLGNSRNDTPPVCTNRTCNGRCRSMPHMLSAVKCIQALFSWRNRPLVCTIWHRIALGPETETPLHNRVPYIV